MDNVVSGPTAFMPDMRRNIFDPAVIVHYAGRQRGEPVHETLPPRVTSALAQIKEKETRRPARRGGLSAKLRRFLERF